MLYFYFCSFPDTFGFKIISSLTQCLFSSVVYFSCICEIYSIYNITISSYNIPSYILCISFVKDKLTIGGWVYFWTLCSIDPYICFCVILHCFDYCGFAVLSEVSNGYPLVLSFFLRTSLVILGLLWFHIDFRIICFSSVKNVSWII